MAAEEKWYFTKEQLENSPSKKCDIDPEKELSFRQQAANFIQDMGQRLQVTQLCINTAIVYMHRFYVFHSFTHFHRNNIAAAALFLAAKVEEQPRKLEHVIKVAHMCLHRESGGPPPPLPDIKSEQYAELAHDLVFNENVLLQTLGFDVAIDHPHTHVVRCCHLVKASKDLAQTSYFLASNSLHLTTMCLKYKPTVVACFCIYLACKWSNWQIPNSTEGKEWFLYVDNSVTQQMLEELTEEFINIYKTCPSRLWKKIQSMSASQGQGKPCSSAYNPPPGDVSFPTSCSSPMTGEPRKTQPPSIPKDLHHSKNHHDSKHNSQQQPQQLAPPHPHRTSHDMQNMNHHVYKEKRDRERQERQAAAGVAGHGYHKAPQVDVKHVPPTGKVPYGTSGGAPVPPAGAAGPYVRHHRSSSGGVNTDPSKMKMHPSQPHPVRSSSSSRSEHGPPPQQQQQQQQRQPAPPPDQPHGSYQRTSGIGDQPHNIGSSGNRESGQFNRPPVTAGGDFTHNRDPMRNSQSYHVKEQSDVKRSDHRLDYTSRDSRSSEQNNSASSQSVPYQKQLDNNSVENSESARHKAVYDKHSVNAPLQAKHENRHRSSRDVTTDIKQKHPQYQKQYVDMKNKQPPPPVSGEKINKFNQIQQPVQKSKSVLHPDEVKSLSSQLNTSKSMEIAQNNRNNSHVMQEEVSKKQIETNDQNNMLPLLQTPPPPPQKQKSIFSPDADISPKHVISTSIKRTKKTPPSSSKKPDIPQMLSDIGTAPLTALSPFGSPPLLPTTPSKSASSKQNRNRTSSSNSEPELVPFIRKLEDETGFENIIRDAKVTIKTNDLPQKRPKPTMRVKPLSTDTVLPNSQSSLSQPIINGIETNPTLISNLLKEAMPVNNLSINEPVKDTPVPVETPVETNHIIPETSSVIEEKKSEHHKSEKKKKKEKHKDKDKERSREEKKKKHKDKDRERHRDRSQAESMATPAESLIITIPKDKIIPVQSETSSQPEIPVKVKIKIQKEWLQTETISNPASAPPNDDLKVRISKAANKKHFVLNNRKRERDETSAPPDPPAKVAKTSYGKQEEATNRQNGRSSYPNKQVTLGDGALVQQQWSNSKYHSKQSGARPAS